jgi:GNAT superfamily N-acetyltransferase
MEPSNTDFDFVPEAEWKIWDQDTLDADCLRRAIHITIREATQEDLDALAQLNERFNDAKTTAAQIAASLANPKCVEIPIVAEVDDRLVGFAGLRVVPLIFYEGAHAELTELFVEESYRRCGVGGALIRFAECLAKSKGAGELVLHTGEENEIGQAFYTAMGYEAWEIVMGKTL